VISSIFFFKDQQESRAGAEKQPDAVVKFYPYRNLQRHRAVLRAMARLLVFYSLSTLETETIVTGTATISRRIRLLSPKTATVVESPVWTRLYASAIKALSTLATTLAIVAEFGDSRRFWRQSPNLSPNSAIVASVDRA